MKRLPCAALTLVLAACNRQETKLENAPTPVHTVAVEMFTPKNGERYSASVLPDRQVTLAFKVSGFVESIYQVRGADGRTRNVDIGDMVAQGTVLARVRVQDYELQVEQATGQLHQARDSEQTVKAQLAQAEANAAKAAQDFERATTLLAAKALTKPEYDAAKAQFDATRAQVEAARSQLQGSAAAIRTTQATLGIANTGLHDTSLVAPFTGSLVQRAVEVGGLAVPGVTAFVLADLSTVKASFGVPDRVVGHVKPGARLGVFVEAIPERPFQGVITQIAAVADSTTRLFQIVVSIPNSGGPLRPGMIAALSLDTAVKAEPVTVVPLNAIIRGKDAGSFAVMVVQGKQARRRPVALGATYGDRVAVTGVTLGERVINSGASMIAEGDAVEVTS